MRKKLRQSEIYKIPTGQFTEAKDKKIRIIPLDLDRRTALENGWVIKIQENQLTHVIQDHLGEDDVDMSSVLVNIFVEPGSKKQGEREYKELAEKGFTLNGDRYVRLLSGSGQIRRNTITFVRENLYRPIIDRLLCGLRFDDFGDAFNAAKFNAYLGLSMSGCHLLPPDLSPRVCVVDDFEEIRPHDIVHHLTERRVEYITLPDRDYILDEGDADFEITDDKAVRKSDSVAFTVRRGICKKIESVPYDEIEGSPALNSFDGQGLASPSWVQRVSDYLGCGYMPSEMIIRAPWVKGLLVTVPFHGFLADRKITRITDSFGKARDISDIDVIISRSQFKMDKIYGQKYGVDAWDYHQDAMDKSGLRWGIARINAGHDASEKRLNYQYLQVLRLDDEDVDALCTRTDEELKKLNSDDIWEIFDQLAVKDDGPDGDDRKKLFQRVIECNPAFINDRHIRSIILRECQKMMDASKIGRLLVHGNYQFCVSDPLAQLEWIERRHCDSDVEVEGVIPPGHVYSEYWLNDPGHTEDIVLMRSPMIDRNEIAKRRVMTERYDLFRYIRSGIIYSINDLTALQQGGCDFDGDIVFSTNDWIIARGCDGYGTAKPLYYDLGNTDLLGPITLDNMIGADIRGLNSKVGSISNKASSLYAMLEDRDEGDHSYDRLYDSVITLGQIIGREIDRIKTSLSPTFPLEWDTLQARKVQRRDLSSDKIETDEELSGIYRHNASVPDRKPYFFRYLYRYIDDAIKQLDRAFGKTALYTYGMRLPKFIETCKNGEATEEMMRLYRQYRRAYPVIDTDCVVNHICKHFEDLEKSVKRRTLREGEDMLLSFVTDTQLDEDVLKAVKDLLAGYQRHKRLMAKSGSDAYDGSKNSREDAYNTLDLLREFYRGEAIKVAGDVQAAFNYMMQAAKSKDIVWEILGADVLKIIKGDMLNAHI